MSIVVVVVEVVLVVVEVVVVVVGPDVETGQPETVIDGPNE